jgi:curli biogenesis system outer membrane secretion channel CsgG
MVLGMGRLLSLLVAVAWLAGCAPSLDTPDQTGLLGSFTAPERPLEERWIIAVPNFEIRAGSVEVTGLDAASQDEAFFKELGSGVADIFVSEAFRSGQFRITERAELDKVLFEQDLAQSGRIDPETAADVGKITGAELIVLGSLTEFGISVTGGGGNVLNVFGGSAESVTARVTVDIRLVDAVTAEVIAIGIGTSQVSQGSIEVDVLNIIRALQAGRSGTPSSISRYATLSGVRLMRRLRAYLKNS